MTHEAMRLLAGPGVPEVVREEAVARADDGKRRITKQRADELNSEIDAPWGEIEQTEAQPA